MEADIGRLQAIQKLCSHSIMANQKSEKPCFIVCIFSLFVSDRHCPALSQPFTRRVLLDQHIQMMHGIRDQDGKTTSSVQTEASDDKKRVQLYGSNVNRIQPYFLLTDSFPHL